MAYDVVISNQAETDLRGIFEYIAFTLQERQTASEQLGRLEKSIKSLEQMPRRFRAYGKEPWHNRGLRIMPVDHYLVFYIPDDNRQSVSIVRVMYGGRDIDGQLERFTTYGQ